MFAWLRLFDFRLRALDTPTGMSPTLVDSNGAASDASDGAASDAPDGAASDAPDGHEEEHATNNEVHFNPAMVGKYLATRIPRADRFMRFVEKDMYHIMGYHLTSLHTLQHYLGNPTDNNKFVTFPKDLVLIAVNCKAIDGVVSEVGLAHVSTEQLQGVPMGARCRNWVKRIRAEPFLLKDTIGKHSKHRGAGSPEDYNKRQEHIERERMNERLLWFIEEVTDRGRLKALLLSHDMAAAIKFLAQFNFMPLGRRQFLDAFDTQRLQAAWTFEVNWNQTGLRELTRTDLRKHRLEHLVHQTGMCVDLRARGMKLRNAATDAIVTLEAALVIINSCARNCDPAGELARYLPPLGRRFHGPEFRGGRTLLQMMRIRSGLAEGSDYHEWV